MKCDQAKPLLYNRALNEGNDPELERHLASCQGCRGELADIELTSKLLRQGLPDEDPPRRIAFVNEAPARNPVRLWQWAFAGAAAFALLFAVLATRHPAAQPVAQVGFTKADVEQIVARAVADSEQRQRAETASVIQGAAQSMADQLHYIHSEQSMVYKQTEQNRSDLRQVTALIGVPTQGVRQ